MTLTQFSNYSARDLRALRLPECPTVEEAKALGAVAVQRTNQNEGTALVNEYLEPVAYVANCETLGGVWCYYSDAVARHYGLRYFADEGKGRG